MQTVSVQRQLLIRLSLVYAFAVLAAMGAFIFEAWQSHQARQDFGAVRLALQLAQRAKLTPQDHPDHGGHPVLAMADEIPEAVGSFAVLQLKTGALLAGSSTTYAHEMMAHLSPTPSTDEEILRKLDTNGVTDYLVVTGSPAGPIAIALRPDNHGLDHGLSWLRHEVLEELLPILLPLLAATLLTVSFTIRRSLALVARLSEQAEHLTPENTAMRLTAEPVPSEIAPLIAAINAALDRISEGFQQQRRFTANVAHQLRNPLAILRSRVEELSDPTIRAGMRADLERMGRLVDQLLAIARLEMRQVQVDERLDLVKVVRATLAELAPLAIADAKEIVLLAPEPPVTVRGNGAALSEAVRNLVENALRYSGADAGAEVEVEVTPAGSVAVRDRGPGVPQAVRTKIFEPFWRGDDARSGGAGLGLAIVAETAAIHGGRAFVEDRPGGGACFRLDIPPVLP